MGAQGARGEQGQPGATNTTVRLGPGGTGTDTAFCQASERVVGGGGVSIDAQGYIWMSNPVDENGNPLVPDGGTPRGWTVGGSIPESVQPPDPGFDTDVLVQAWVICALP